MRNVTIFILAAMAVLVWAGPANAGMLYETEFEATTPPPPSFTEGGTVHDIDGWWVNPLYEDFITTEVGRIGDAGMSLCNPDGHAQVARIFTNTTDWNVVSEVKVKMSGIGHLYLHLIESAGNGTGPKVYFDDTGKITAYNGGYQVLKNADDSDMTYSANKVYGVKVVADASTDTYDIYIDDIDSGSGYVLGGEDFSFWGNIGMIDRFYVNIYTVVVTVDNLSIVGLDAGLAGDLDGDGDVDGDDLDFILADWGNAPPVDSWADPNADGVVDGDDLDCVLANWGQGTGGGPESAPEPMTMTLLGLGGLALIRRRRR